MISPSAARNRTLCAAVFVAVVIAVLGHVYPPAEAAGSRQAASHHDDDHAADAAHAMLCVATLPTAQAGGCAAAEASWTGATFALAISAPAVATTAPASDVAPARTAPPLFLLYATLLI